MTKVVYIHEKSSFIHGLMEILWRNFRRKDLCKGGLDKNGHLREDTAARFSLEYSIPYSQVKDVSMTSEDDWSTFLDEAGQKPSGRANLVIKEKQVSICTFSKFLSRPDL